MSNFTWTEIKKWAKDRGLEPKKIKGGGYEWEGQHYDDIKDLVTDLWNKITNNKWVEYQKEYRSKNPPT